MMEILDIDEEVVHIYDHDTGVTTNLGLVSRHLVSDGNLVVIAVNERSQGKDLNNDGDLDDSVPHIYDRSLELLLTWE